MTEWMKVKEYKNKLTNYKKSCFPEDEMMKRE